MKKLKLKLDGIKEMLSKEQMQKINGGYDGLDSRCTLVTSDDYYASEYNYREIICYGDNNSSNCWSSIFYGYCSGVSYPQVCYVDYCTSF